MKKISLVEKYTKHGGSEEFNVPANTNLLEGVRDADKNGLAILLENTTTNSSGAFASVAFPLIKRTHDKIISKELVTFHPIDKPHGSIFFWYPKISQRIVSGSNSKHPSSVSDFYNECVGFNCPKSYVEGCKSFYDGLYNDSFCDQTKGEYNVIVASGEQFSFDGDSCVDDFQAVTSVDGSMRFAGFLIDGFERAIQRQGVPYNDGRGAEMDVEEFITSFKVVNSGDPILDANGHILYETGDEVLYRFYAQKYGEPIAGYSDICDDTGSLLIEIDLTQPLSSGDTETFDGYIGIDPSTDLSNNFTFSWKRYKTIEGSMHIGEQTFDMKRLNVSTIDRASRANWSPQLQQSLKSYQNIEADIEIVNSMSQQIALEIDREVLLDLKNAAPWVLRHDYLGWRNNSQFYTQETWNKKLMDKINQVSSQIHKTTGCGGANWVVLSPEAAAMFTELAVIKIGNKLSELDKYNVGLKQVGVLGGRYDAYIDAFAKPNDILVGYKPEGLINVGYIFAPYQLAHVTNTVVDVNTFANTKAIITRYAKKFTNSKMYGRIHIDNVPTFDKKESR